MLDNATCVLTLVAVNEKVNGEEVLKSTQVEYWLDEGTFHYNDLYYDLDGGFIDSEEAGLTDIEKGQCDSAIQNWLLERNIDF